MLEFSVDLGATDDCSLCSKAAERGCIVSSANMKDNLVRAGVVPAVVREGTRIVHAASSHPRSSGELM